MIEVVPLAVEGEEPAWMARTQADWDAMQQIRWKRPWVYRICVFIDKALAAGVAVSFRADLPAQSEPQPA
jgi:hypothetical protein